MHRYAALLFCGVAGGFQNDAVSHEKDVYVIYSLLLTNPKTSHGPDNNERYLIANMTGPGNPATPCVNPPKEREAEFREVLADFAHRQGERRELKRFFSIRKPYVLLSASDVKAFQADRWLTPDRVPDARFVGVTDLFTLSDVYFNPRHTLALTAISSWCGGLCALYQWKVFEKIGTDHWEERPWVGCVTIADAHASVAK